MIEWTSNHLLLYHYTVKHNNTICGAFHPIQSQRTQSNYSAIVVLSTAALLLRGLYPALSFFITWWISSNSIVLILWWACSWVMMKTLAWHGSTWSSQVLILSLNRTCNNHWPSHCILLWIRRVVLLNLFRISTWHELRIN
jgi:hypothetical protein